MTSERDIAMGRQGNLVIHKLIRKGEPDAIMAWFWCPGCEDAHAYEIPRWTFNWNYAEPTFAPSLLCQSTKRCHLFLTSGKIHFLGDCSHPLAGQTVDLPEPPEWLCD